jgi:hypothetical protein
MALASILGWSYDDFHELMKEWGYGSSLRKLSPEKLFQLRRELLDICNDRKAGWNLDAQGKRMWYLLRQAGWNRKRLTYYLTKHYKKTHWNALTQNETRGVMKMLKLYGDKKAKEQK